MTGKNLPQLTRMTAAEFEKFSRFSYENYLIETAKSSGSDIEAVRAKVGGAPKVARENDLWLLIKIQDQNAGYLWVEIKEDGEAFGWDIFLDEAYRSKGIGREVMLETGKFLKKQGVNRIRICVVEKNAIARALYQSLGFTEVDFNETQKRFTLELKV